MYAKVFAQIFDSSIADDFRLRHFFMDLLVLADRNGVVDMTATAISARTRIPLKDVQSLLAKLEQPDEESRTPDHDGRRIAKLDEHRSWGWCIINYARFRQIASEEQRREKTRLRVAKFRQKDQQNGTCNAHVTPCDAGNAMQKQRHMQKQREGEEAPAPAISEIPTEQDAITMTATAGIPEAFSRHVYQDWASRSGKDAGGVVVSFLPYVSKRWARESVEWRGGTHKGNKKQTRPGEVSFEKERL